MLDKRTLNRINDRPRSRGPVVYAILEVVVAVLLAALLSYALAAAVLLAGALVVYLLHQRHARARTVKLVYAPGVAASPNFAAVRSACKALSEADKTWRVEEGARRPDGTLLGRGAASSGDAASPRHLVEVGPSEPPGVSANVDVWGIKTDAASLYFLPEAALSHSEDRYKAISYDSLGVVYQPSRYVESGEIPGDAEVVGETWKFVKADGAPDPRRSDNPRYSVVSYGLLSVTGAGPAMRLLVSNKAAAVRFAQAFGAGDTTPGQSEEPGERKASARRQRTRRRAEAKAEKSGALLKVLGVEPGASPEVIHAAYKKKARMYHPDRVANMDPEVREMAEFRMKEINAAYAELKHKGR